MGSWIVVSYEPPILGHDYTAPSYGPTGKTTHVEMLQQSILQNLQYQIDFL